MAGFRPLKVPAALFEEKNPKGSFFGGTFEKNFRRVHYLAAPLIEKSDPPCAETGHP